MTGTESNPTIKPNQTSLNLQNIAQQFASIQSMSTDSYGLSMYDSHMIKNMEWGSVAYLTYSKYGRCTGDSCEEVWINNTNTGSGASGQGTQWSSCITGCSGASASADVKNNMKSCETGRDYKQAGVKASTTNNIYGIYDMSGGTWERTMAGVANSSGSYIASNSGLGTQPNTKYFDLYPTNTDSTKVSGNKLGDGIKETRKVSTGNLNGWYSDYGYYPITSYPWFALGGCSRNGSGTGLFAVSYSNGGQGADNGSRAVLTP